MIELFKKICFKQSSNTTKINTNVVSGKHITSVNDSVPGTITIPQTEIPKQGQDNMSKYSNVIVHLDPGHAKSTPGKRSPYSSHKVLPAIEFYEYEFNREIVSMVEKKLKELGFIVNVVVPEVDVDVKLTERYKRVNKVIFDNPGKKNLFISVHANAAGNGSSWMSGKGWAAYTTVGQNNSDNFADCLYDAADEILKSKGIKIRVSCTDGDRDYEENFTVIYGANCPAVLTENCFYDNIDDAKFITSKEGKRAIADVHVSGVKRYVDKYMK